MAVKLRYVELEPDRIFNWLDPKNITCWGTYPEWHNKWWEPEIIKLREQFGKIWTEEFDKITGHFSKLEESILKDGIHHPINCATGYPRDAFLQKRLDNNHFPLETHANIEQIIYSQTFGGSRLTIAQKYGIKIPCVIHDFSELFAECEEVTNKNYTKWFSNNYKFVNSMPYIRLTLHTHLTGKYEGMNNNTRNAQNEAVRLAKEKLNA